MTAEQRPSPSKKKAFRLTNKTLLIMVGALSAVLVLLLILGGNLIKEAPQDTSAPVLGSQSTENTTPSTEATEGGLAERCQLVKDQQQIVKSRREKPENVSSSLMKN